MGMAPWAWPHPLENIPLHQTNSLPQIMIFEQPPSGGGYFIAINRIAFHWDRIQNESPCIINQHERLIWVLAMINISQNVCNWTLSIVCGRQGALSWSLSDAVQKWRCCPCGCCRRKCAHAHVCFIRIPKIEYEKRLKLSKVDKGQLPITVDVNC